eukprot:COSAG06_NODE_71163_length_187_cov_27.386364_1_plen_43_part_10
MSCPPHPAAAAEGGEGGAGKSQSWRRASVVAVGAKVSADAVRR